MRVRRIVRPLSFFALATVIGCGGSDSDSGFPSGYAADGVPELYEMPAESATLADGSRLFFVAAPKEDESLEGFAQLYPASGGEPVTYEVVGTDHDHHLSVELEEGDGTGEKDRYHFEANRADDGTLTSAHLSPGADAGTEPEQDLTFTAAALKRVSVPASRATNAQQVTFPGPDGNIVIDVIPIDIIWLLPNVELMGRTTKPILQDLFFCYWPGQSWGWFDVWKAGKHVVRGHIPFVNGKLSSDNFQQVQVLTNHGWSPAPWAPYTSPSGSAIVSL